MYRSISIQSEPIIQFQSELVLHILVMSSGNSPGSVLTNIFHLQLLRFDFLLKGLKEAGWQG